MNVVPPLNYTFDEIFAAKYVFYNAGEGESPHHKYRRLLASNGIILQNYDNDQCDCLFLINNLSIKQMWRFRDKKKIYLAFEPEVAYPINGEKGLKILLKYFNGIITWNDNVAGLENIYKTNYYFDFVAYNKEVEFQKKKLLTSISTHKKTDYPGELYSERERLIDYFALNHSEEFDFFGSGWEHKHYQSYQGRCDSKLETYTKYKFVLAFENCNNAPGYVTEKIFDCFSAGTVPIYAGAPNVKEYIPEGCYIDYYQFNDPEELYAYLANMTESRYEEYLKNINEFISSEKIVGYSLNHFSKVLQAAITDQRHIVKFGYGGMALLMLEKFKALISKELHRRRSLREIMNSIIYRVKNAKRFGF